MSRRVCKEEGYIRFLHELSVEEGLLACFVWRERGASYCRCAPPTWYRTRVRHLCAGLPSMHLDIGLSHEHQWLPDFFITPRSSRSGVSYKESHSTSLIPRTCITSNGWAPLVRHHSGPRYWSFAGEWYLVMPGGLRVVGVLLLEEQHPDCGQL